MRSERGQSLSVFVAVVVVALLLVAGLVVDGGRQSAASRRAELVAASAARAAVDQTATARLAGVRPDGGAAVAAARAAMAADPDLSAEIRVRADGRIEVVTRTSVPTVFLSLIGVNRLEARGRAEAQLFSR